MLEKEKPLINYQERMLQLWPKSDNVTVKSDHPYLIIPMVDAETVAAVLPAEVTEPAERRRLYESEALDQLHKEAMMAIDNIHKHTTLKLFKHMKW